MNRHVGSHLVFLGMLLCGCRQTLIDRTDRSVYRVIEEQQKASIGATSDVRIGSETGDISAHSRIYDFVPRPVDANVPDAFKPMENANSANESGTADAEKTAAQAAESSTSVDSKGEETSSGVGDGKPTPYPNAGIPGDQGQATPVSSPERTISPSVFTEEELARVQTLRLQDALAYAMRHSRELQDAKEELYLAALDLTLERHLWTPQFVASVQAEFADYGQVRDFDRAMTAVSDVGVTQRLPFGGEVTARVINTLMRDLGRRVTSGETGNFILSANLPLLRGAGRSAYESRYQAERDLIYAVRTYETFRRAFAVQTAGDYFQLQQSKAAIQNAHKSYLSRAEDANKAEFINVMGRSRNVFDAQRARSSFRRAESQLVSAREQYASALDRFKISIGMPVDTLLDVVDQEDDRESVFFERLRSRVDEGTAVAAAMKYRLDLLTTADRADDARRGVKVAKNRILPDLDATGSATMDTDPDRLNSTSYNTERVTWRGAIELQMDDRKTERNAYRASIVALRRSERTLDQFTDSVRADVRSALRRIDQQEKLLVIQTMNVEENQLRLEAARAQFDLGKNTNQDVVDADEDLLAARNEYARAVAAYRVAILEFRRDTGTLRVTDEGKWDTSAAPIGD